MGLQLNSNEIAEILPHRYPFALVDRITDGESGVWAKGTWQPSFYRAKAILHCQSHSAN